MAFGANKAAKEIMSLGYFQQQDLEILDIDGETCLHTAILAENTKGLALLVEKSSFNFADRFYENSENIVQFAINRQHPKCLKVLTKKFKDYENKFPKTDIPKDDIFQLLPRLISGNNLKTFKRFFKNNEELAKRRLEFGEWTLLHYAASENRPNFVKYLINCWKGSIREIKATDGSTALHIAASQNHVECVEILLEGCTFNYLFLEDIEGRSAVDWAEMYGGRLYDSFLNRSDPRKNEENTYKPFEDIELIALKTIKMCVQCVEENEIDELKEIVESDPTLLKRRLDTDRWNLLHFSIANEHTKFVKCLLKLAKKHMKKDEFSSYVNTKTFNGDTALIMAVRVGIVEIVKILLKYSDETSLKQCDKNNNTPIAIAGRNREIKKLLKEKSALFSGSYNEDQDEKSSETEPFLSEKAYSRGCAISKLAVCLLICTFFLILWLFAL